MKHTGIYLVRDVVVALAIAAVILPLIALATHGPNSQSIGFPLPYETPLNCGGLNPGCGSLYSFNPITILLDYLFWTGLVFLIVYRFDRRLHPKI